MCLAFPVIHALDDGYDVYFVTDASGNEVEGKVAQVTGAASGIGRAVAELLRARDAKVVAEDIDPAVKDLERDGLISLKADVTADGSAGRQ